MQVVTFTQARNSLRKLLDNVTADADYAVITRRDAEDAVVMSLENFNSLMETVYLLRSPANAAYLAESIAQYNNGEIVERPLINVDALNDE